MAVHNVSWTDERVEELKKLWAEGLSCSLIARALGNTTRNAVIGKISRLGLSGRRSPTVRSNLQRKPRTQLRRGFAFMGTPKVVSPEPFTARVVELPPLNISLLDLGAKQCRYPVTDDKPFIFCGHAQQAHSSYCPSHHQICCTPVIRNFTDTTRARLRARTWKNNTPAFITPAEAAE